MYVITIQLRHRQRNGRTDGRTDDILVAIQRYERTCFSR